MFLEYEKDTSTKKYRKVTWSEFHVLRMDPLRISLLLRSNYYFLPSPSNLLKWDLFETPDCQLWVARGTLACPVRLQVGTKTQYRLKHGQVLRTLADALEKEWQKEKLTSRNDAEGIKFANAGVTARTSRESNNLLHGSKWQMKMNLRRRLVFLMESKPRIPKMYVVFGRPEHHHHWTHIDMGRMMRWGSRKEEFEVLGTEGSISGSWLKDLVIPCWSGVPRIFCLEIAESNQVTSQHSKESNQVTIPFGFSLFLALFGYHFPTLETIFFG